MRLNDLKVYNYDLIYTIDDDMHNYYEVTR